MLDLLVSQCYNTHIRNREIQKNLTYQPNTKEKNKMNNIYFEKLKSEILWSATCTNKNANDKDINRNHVNYGCTTTYASVLRDFGFSVDVPVYGDNELLRIPYIEIDGIKIQLER